jgi:hypothetical protein
VQYGETGHFRCRPRRDSHDPADRKGTRLNCSFSDQLFANCPAWTINRCLFAQHDSAGGEQGTGRATKMAPRGDLRTPLFRAAARRPPFWLDPLPRGTNESIPVGSMGTHGALFLTQEASYATSDFWSRGPPAGISIGTSSLAPSAHFFAKITRGPGPRSSLPGPRSAACSAPAPRSAGSAPW